MSEKTKVILDAMGGDNSPGEMVLGAVNAVNEKSDLFVYIVGQIVFGMLLVVVLVIAMLIGVIAPYL